MNTKSVACKLNHLLCRLALAACVAILPLAAGCSQQSVHNLEELAASSMSAQESEQLKIDLASVTPDDRTPAGLAKAAAVLARVNPLAPSSPAARAAQATVVGRLFHEPMTEPAADWFTPDLLAQLDEVFTQADTRLRTQPPDLMTAMVWARTGTTLHKAPEINETLTRAVKDPQLKGALREDNPTRERLHSYATLANSQSGWRMPDDVVYLAPPDEFGDVVFRPVLAVIFVPVLMVYVIVCIFTGKCEL